MNSYDFLNLSYIEFEELVRDLFEREIQSPLESFAAGKDGGIDLRCFISSKDQLVIQCKRMKNFGDLYSALKKEKEKIGHIKPHRYIIATNVDLTVTQKERIYSLLNEHIRTPGDIFGKKDLNALLRRHKEVEQQHFKLWISSTNVLETVLNSKVINQSKFELERIRELLDYYVATPNLNEALKILEAQRYVIISGNPGVGKTSLARVISFHYLAQMGYEEFIFLSNSIDEAYKLYKPGVKQIFFYDDFLGQNFEEGRLKRNEDKRLVMFIDQIHHSIDKIFICTTREYVLKDARDRYETLNSLNFDLVKSVVNLKQYDIYLKARILYSLLNVSNLPKQLLAIFSEESVHHPILVHRNFNPRVIAHSLRLTLKSHPSEAEFIETIHQNLEKPVFLWQHAYTQQISRFSQILLAILNTTRGILWKDAAAAMQAFIDMHGLKYGLRYSELEFRQSIRELEGSFLIVEQDVNGTLGLRFYDASVIDFLLAFLNDHREILKDVLSAAIFFDQFFYAFVNRPDLTRFFPTAGREIKCDDAINEIRINRIIKDFDILESSGYIPNHYDLETLIPTFERFHLDRFERLEEFLYDFETGDPQQYSVVEEFVCRRLQENLYNLQPNAGYHNLYSYLSLIERLRNKINIDPETFISRLYAQMPMDQYIDHYQTLQRLFPDEHYHIITNSFFLSELESKLYDWVVGEDRVRDNMINDILMLSEIYEIDVGEAFELAERKKVAYDQAFEQFMQQWGEYIQQQKTDVKHLTIVEPPPRSYGTGDVISLFATLSID